MWLKGLDITKFMLAVLNRYLVGVVKMLRQELWNTKCYTASPGDFREAIHYYKQISGKSDRYKIR